MKGDNMKNKKRNKLDPIGNLIRYGSFSAKWTALFALIAVFSVMVLGLTQVSFAAGPVEYPDRLTDTRISSVAEYSGDWLPNGQIKLKYAKANGVEVPVYCLEEWKQYGDGYNYVRTDDKTYLTPGVVAMLTYANSNPGLWNKNLADDINGTKQQQAITQLAIWVYLYKNNINNYQSQATEMADVIDKLTDDSGAQNDGFGPWINKLVKYGEDHAQEYTQPTATISSPNGEFQLSGDQQYMVSPEMTVSISPSETLQSFKLGLDNAPEGTKVVINDGEEYDASQLAGHDFNKSELGMKIKVKVPKDKLTEESKTFNLTIDAVNTYYVGWEYKQEGSVGDDAQRIAAGTIASPTSQGSVSLTASYKVDVPKTAQNSSVILYIVGLISGVGVIYANVKPAKQK